jgi:hypothetical protein
VSIEREADGSADRRSRSPSSGGRPASRVLLDPTGERAAPTREAAPRPTSLDGRTIGLLDISKPRGNVFLDRLEEQLVGRALEVRRFAKPTFSKPAPIDLRHEIATKCDLVIEALAD